MPRGWSWLCWRRRSPRAAEALPDALASIREKWEPETTARNLRLIREARERRGESMPWAKKIEDELWPKRTRSTVSNSAPFGGGKRK